VLFQNASSLFLLSAEYILSEDREYSNTENFQDIRKQILSKVEKIPKINFPHDIDAKERTL